MESNSIYFSPIVVFSNRRFFVHGTVHGPAHPRGQPERLQRHGREQKGGGYPWEKVHADTRDSGRQRALPAEHGAEQGPGEQRHNVPAADLHGRGARARQRLPPSLSHDGPILGQLSGILGRIPLTPLFPRIDSRISRRGSSRNGKKEGRVMACKLASKGTRIDTRRMLDA